MGSARHLGGGFDHYYAAALEKFECPINRFVMEVKRQLDVLGRNLAERRYRCGDNYDIADIATYPWYRSVVLINIYDAEVLLGAKAYTNVARWWSEIAERLTGGPGEIQCWSSIGRVDGKK